MQNPVRQYFSNMSLPVEKDVFPSSSIANINYFFLVFSLSPGGDVSQL